MKTYCFISLLFFFACGCKEETNPDSSFGLVTITGHQYPEFVSPSRSSTEISSFQPGDRISFFSSGSLIADGITLTFDGKRWIPEIPLEWTGNETAHYTAVFPAMETNEDGTFNASTLYDNNGQLKDILFCQGNSEHGTEISLHFTHRFAQLQLQLKNNFNHQLEEVVCKSRLIESFNPRTNEIVYQTSGNLHEEKRTQQNNGTYSFITPPTSSTSHTDIELTFFIQDKTHFSHTLSDQTFEPGNAYICHVIKKDSSIGIHNAEDFIAFTHLINGEEYNGRSLDEFGETINGRTTYYLRNDIEFTEEESEKLTHIGSNLNGNNSPFKDIFDGQGYTLSNIILNKNVGWQSNYGLWGEIGETGVVCNLILDNISYTQNGKFSYLGLLTGENYGTIYNCILQNSSISMTNTNATSADFGGLVCYNKGKIYNCQVINLTLRAKHKNWTAAGLVRFNHGKLLNCATANVVLTTMQNGSLLCNRNYHQIQNCYVYKTSESKYNPISLQALTNSYINYCYYPENFTIKAVGITDESALFTSTKKYNKSSYIISGTDELLHERLNRWIDEVGKEEYPDLEFIRWEKGENLPAVLIMP